MTVRAARQLHDHRTILHRDNRVAGLLCASAQGDGSQKKKRGIVYGIEPSAMSKC